MQTHDGTFYHDPLAHQKSLADLLAYKRFSASRFAKSVAGILKILITVLFLVAGALFLSSELCPSAPPWYVWLYPAATFITAVLTICSYLCYMLGVAEDNPDNWVKGDLTLTALEVVLTVGVAIATLTSCESGDSRYLYFGPLALAGSLLVAVSGGALYMMWRARDEVPQPAPITMGADRLRSHSVHI